MNELLAYYRGHYGGGHGIGSWVAHTVARDLIYRAVGAATRGLDAGELICLAIIAVWLVWAFSRR